LKFTLPLGSSWFVATLVDVAWAAVTGVARGIKRLVAGVEVVVAVQHDVGAEAVEQFPEGLSGLAFLGDAVGGAEGGLMPVGEGTG
jgi:hypothetical protein